MTFDKEKFKQLVPSVLSTPEQQIKFVNHCFDMYNDEKCKSIIKQIREDVKK